MGWTYHSLNHLPGLYDIVGCKWPLTNKPDEVRPCLVVQIIKRIDEEGTAFATLKLCYGTSQYTYSQLKRDLFISHSDYRALGLDRPTRFSMDLVREFIWGPQWFPGRIRFGGPLSNVQIDAFKNCWKRHHGGGVST